MKNTRKISRVNGKIIVSELVLSGALLVGACTVYTPAEPIRKQGIEAQYITDGKYDIKKSEQRKKELIANIREIRKQMAAVAMSTQHRDENTIVRPQPQKVKEALRSLESIEKLTSSIFA